MDSQPVVEGKAGVAVAQVGGCSVLLQFGGECGERVREALQEREHLFGRQLAAILGLA